MLNIWASSYETLEAVQVAKCSMPKVCKIMTPSAYVMPGSHC